MATYRSKHIDRYYDPKTETTDYEAWLTDFANEIHAATNNVERIAAMRKYDIGFKQRG